MRSVLRSMAPVLLLAAAQAGAVPAFSEVVVFGDSLSDTGNVFAATGRTTPATAVTGDAFVPIFPYARGAGLEPAFSNGPIWVELLAAGLGLGLAPSALGGSNYAFGGSDLAPGSLLSIVDQVSGFIAALDAAGIGADPDALYVVWGGGNDVRGAFGDPALAIGNYALGLTLSVVGLASRGAEQFLIPNVPDIGLLPALQDIPALSAFGTALSSGFNAVYDRTLASLELALGIDITRLDVEDLVRDVVADPSVFGLLDASSACAADPACRADPRALFWDAIHPTSAAHAIVAARALEALSAPVSVPAPGSAPLVLAMAVLVLSRRARAMPRPP